MFTKEQKQQRRKGDFGIALFFVVIFIVGSVLFIVAGFSPFPDMPPASSWLLRAGAWLIGVVCLILTFFFILQVCMLLSGKRSWTFKLGRPHSDK